MVTTSAPGWTADWLNAWLAAIGVTVLCPEVSLSWSEDGPPHAIFEISGSTPLPDLVAARLPRRDEISGYAIARHADRCAESFDRHVSPRAFVERAELSRRGGDHTLSSTVTDLTVDPSTRAQSIDHSPFDPAAPKGITLHERLLSVTDIISTDTVEQIGASSL